MERANDIRVSGSFLCKKWTLFTLCAVGIVATIVMASLASKLLDKYVDSEFSGSSAEYRRTVKEGAMIWVWVISVLAILFHLMGLMGAYKEHFCMTVAYAVLITLSALSSIGYATKNGVYWVETVLFFAICGVSYAFAYDLRRIRRIQFSSPAMIVIGGAPNAVINVAPGQQYVPAGQAYVAPNYGQPSGAQNWNPPPYSPENKTNY